MSGLAVGCFMPKLRTLNVVLRYVPVWKEHCVFWYEKDDHSGCDMHAYQSLSEPADHDIDTFGRREGLYVMDAYRRSRAAKEEDLSDNERDGLRSFRSECEQYSKCEVVIKKRLVRN